MKKILWNDSIIDRKRLIDIEDRGYQFGDGVYEVIGVYKGNLFMMEEHLERLERSAKEIRLRLPYHKEHIASQLKKLVSINKLRDGVIYLQVSRGTAERWHYFPPSSTEPNLVAYTKLESTMKYEEEHGACAILTEDIRWLRCDIKTLNLLPNVLAKQKAFEKGAIEAIFYRGDVITEACASNVFIVKNDVVYTHPANQFILNGITRQKVLSLCKKHNIQVKEETFTIQDIIFADEVFITATKLDVVPIVKIDERPIANGLPGVITKKIINLYREAVEEAAIK